MFDNTIDIMLDLEFFGTEEDMVMEYPGEDATPIVTSIGMVIQSNNEIIYANNIALNMQEQLDSGAKFGKGCMLNFWTHQPLFGKEFARSMACNTPIYISLETITRVINEVRETYPTHNICVWGNNILADNGKVIRLYSKYSKNKELPFSYFEHRDYREFRKTVELCTDFSMVNSQIILEKDLLAGKYAKYGFAQVTEHDAMYDCFKQLHHLNCMRYSIKSVNEQKTIQLQTKKLNVGGIKC